MEKLRFSDGLAFRTHVLVQVFDRHGRLIDTPCDAPNFIVDGGKAEAIAVLGGLLPGKRLFRMALGDQGCVAGEPFVPKVPDATWSARTALFHEVGRKDISILSAVPGNAKAIRIATTFLSSDFSAAAFSTTPPVVNEAALIISDGTPGPQINPPTLPDADETMFSLRTFKSAPFDPLDGITVTVTWTIYVV